MYQLFLLLWLQLVLSPTLNASSTSEMQLATCMLPLLWKCFFNFIRRFTFLSVARALEYVGTSAYLGAFLYESPTSLILKAGAAPLVQDKSLLSAAASITTVSSLFSVSCDV